MFQMEWQELSKSYTATNSLDASTILCELNNYKQPFKIPNAVFGETSGSDIPLEHGLQARKHFMKLHLILIVVLIS